MNKKIFLLLFFSFVGSASAEVTVFQEITQINFNGQANLTYFLGGAKWGAPSCPNATHVQLPATLPGRKELLSLATAAKMAGRKVQFWGYCNTDTDYFDTFYIVVQ